jgi:hypothetical protein
MDLGPKMLPNEASNETDDRDTKSGLFQQGVHTPIKPLERKRALISIKLKNLSSYPALSNSPKSLILLRK